MRSLNGIRKGFTLIEMLVVIAIIGILASLSIFNLWKPMESAVNKEARLNLKLIRAAERAYRLETGTYAAGNNETVLNEKLRLQLPVGAASKNWNYSVTVSGTDTFNATATNAKDENKVYYITQDMEDPQEDKVSHIE
jgi:prepilin-type N-terminal cleavage/methylation domain-containing protein